MYSNHRAKIELLLGSLKKDRKSSPKVSNAFRRSLFNELKEYIETIEVYVSDWWGEDYLDEQRYEFMRTLRKLNWWLNRDEIKAYCLIVNLEYLLCAYVDDGYFDERSC